MRTSINLFLLSLIFSSSIFATGIGIVNGSSGIYLTVKATNTVVTVRDQIAITMTTQVLQNNTGEAVNIKYGYPLNENANPTKLRWNYNNEWNEATISTLPQDNSIPGGGGGSGGAELPLQKFLGENPLFFSPNEEVAPGSEITLEITYVELLPYFLGKVTYSHVNDISELQSEAVISQSFSFSLESEKEVLSIDLLGLNYNEETTGNITRLDFISDEQLGDFDYQVEYELSSEAIGVTSLSTMIPDSLFECDDFGDGYFTMIIEPESNVDTEVIEKNFSLIIDRSGSMSGDKIVQAKDAATFIVQNLNFGDNFNIIDFSSNVTSFSDALVEYNLQNEAEALAYIDNINSGGSTNISEALLTSINQFNVVQEDKANIIIFCTDGEATAGVTSTSGILSLIESEINSTEKDVFLFTIGIGANLDQALLTLLARENNGLVQFLEPETLEEDLVTFFLSVNNPVLLNTEITFSPNIIKEIYPYPYPNLYKGQQLILSGRYEEADEVNVNLKGKAFNVPVDYDFQISLNDSTDNNVSFLPKLWAKQKIDVLSLDYYLAETEVEQNSISSLIDSLSTCYGVVAVEFSSFDDSTTEINELSLLDVSSAVDYFPNPITDEVTIIIPELVNISSQAVIRILDSGAREIMEVDAQLRNGRVMLDGLSILDRGIYFIIIEFNSKQYIAKVIK